MARGSGRRVLAAVLFTDIVDSTAVASRMGDARWKELVARHHAIVRRALRSFGGTELDTAGDGFFASFREPAAAIRCACVVSESVRELGIEIRAGVHFGECERADGKLTGLAVVVGSRVMSLGGAGDVLVTASTGELVAGAGLAFEDRGTHPLKGVDGTWRVASVTAVDDVPRPRPADREQADQRLAAIGASASPGRRRILGAGLAATLVLVVVLALLLPNWWAEDRPDRSIDLASNATARIDATDGTLEQMGVLEERPGASTLGFGSLWVAWPDRGRVARLDLEDGSVVDTIAVGATPSGLAVTDDAIWVANASDGTIDRIDPATNEVSRSFDAGASPTAIAAGGDALWVADSIGSRLLRVDPSTGRTTSIQLSGQPAAVAYTPDGVWVSVAPSSVARVDPDSASLTFTQDVGNGPTAVLAAHDSIWVANHLDATVSRLDPATGTERAKIPVLEGPSALAVAGGRIWVASAFADVIQEIDPGTDAVARSIPVGASAASLATEGDALWLTSGASSDEHRGGTLHVASGVGRPALDPGVADDAQAWSILSVTNDGLVAYRKTGGPGGVMLVADLARSLPQVSDDGLTYRFEMRDDVRYSTGQAVVPQDFRHGLQRAVSLNKYASLLFPAIGGVENCYRDPQTCDLSDAIRIDGSSITISLSRPDPDLLYKLALPFGSVVPTSTPVRRLPATDVPATGPYVIDSVGDQSVELVRNPEFREWSAAAQPDGYVDAISWRFEAPPGASFGRLLAGELDLMTDIPTAEDHATLLAEHPDQAISAPKPQTYLVGFDTLKPPFDDPRVRRAVNYAIDRQLAADRLGGPLVTRITCQVLPPTLPGFEASCPYTKEPEAGVWSSPDLERARSLVEAAGARGAKVTVWVPGGEVPPGWTALMRDVTRVLDDLGLRATSESSTEAGAYFDRIYRFGVPGSADHPQIFFGGWISDFPRTSDFLETQFRCNGFGNAAGFCDRELDERMDEAKLLERTDPGAAARAWAAIEKEILDAAVQAPLVNAIATYPVSSRTGNVQIHPQWGVLTSLLWVQ